MRYKPNMTAEELAQWRYELAEKDAIAKERYDTYSPYLNQVAERFVRSCSTLLDGTFDVVNITFGGSMVRDGVTIQVVQPPMNLEEKIRLLLVQELRIAYNNGRHDALRGANRSKPERR